MLFLFVVLAVSTVSIYAKNSFIITVPQYIRPGIDADVCVNILKRRGVVTVTATLMDNNETQILSTVTGRVRPMTQTVLKLKVPVDIKRDTYRIRVIGSGNISFNKTARRVRTRSQSTGLFIQTDRPVYKPGDLVRFRTFGIHPNLTYVKEPMDIFIRDPKRNIIQQYLDVTAPFGVFGGEFQLSSVTTHGSWTIKVNQLRRTTSRYFRVRPYVLPKFEVNIIVPPGQVNTSEYFEFGVTAKYTFGKPVIGVVNATLRSGRFSLPIREINKIFKIEGTAQIRILMKEVVSRIGYNFRIFVGVTESITGNRANDTVYTYIDRYGNRVTFANSQASVFKPGLEFKYIFRVTKLDNTPFPYPAGKVNITVYYDVYKNVSVKPKLQDNYQEERNYTSRCPPIPPRDQKVLVTKLVDIPENGIIVDSIMFPMNAVSGRITVNYKKRTTTRYLGRAGSASNNFIQIELSNNDKVQVGEPLQLVIKGTEEVNLCYYKIFTKDSLVQNGRVSPCLDESHSNTQSIRTDANMAPSAVLLLYYVRRDGEVVADSIRFYIGDVLQNKLAISYDKTRVVPAEKVELQIQADPYSLVNVLAVDKSVLLMATGNDITVRNVLSTLRIISSFYYPRLERWDTWLPSPIYGRDALAVFDYSGVYVLTDANLYQYNGLPLQGGTSLLRSSAGVSAFTSSVGGPGSPGPSAELASPSRTRTFFPETWLWANTTTGIDGRATIQATAPDTITEWVTSAFAMNPATGLGVADTLANLTTFQRFFIRLELPYSAIRGEILVLQATIFNYLETRLEVLVKLNSVEHLVFSDNRGNEISPTDGGLTKTISVDANGLGAVYFPIITKKVGTVKLQVSARSREIADAVERELLIEAEGIKQRYNLPVLIDLRNTDSFMTALNIKFPPNVIPDSQFIKVSVIGDLMAQVLRGINNLLRMSYGCGEQNLLRFSPNVYVSNYLRKTNKITPRITERIQNLLKLGYQRQLSYMRPDGSFSAFGTNDRNGSTWLTAFVVRSFSQAANLTFIDPDVMKKAIEYILRQQDKGSGEFQERGIIYNKGMQGGSASSKKAMTAYVLISLLEAKQHGQIPSQLEEQANNAISKAIEYISDGGPATVDNLYELIIICYALTLAKNRTAEEFLTVVEQEASTDGSNKYWILPWTEAEVISPWRGWAPPRTRPRALDIEMTSYVLLIYGLKGDKLNGLKVLLWLGEQRNSYGGFISTQDTVVALQALAEIAAEFYSPNFNIDVEVMALQWSRTLNVNDNNSLVLQTEDVDNPSTVDTITIDAKGKGICLVQAAVFYNVPEELREPAFELNITVLQDSIKGFRLRVCFRWLRSGESTMGYLEIETPTGMEADITSLDTKQTDGLFKRIEQAFRQVNLYFDKIVSKQMCIEIDINRVALVARHRAVPVRLSEYYEQSNEVIKLYSSPTLRDATVFEVCAGGVCEEVKK